MEFTNTYNDARCAESYSRLEFPGTYYLAYRDLRKIFAAHIKGAKALDFGCGAGRSTRFLRDCGFAADGVDISASMIKKASEIDPEGSYMHIADGDFGKLTQGRYDLILSMFTFDNIPGEGNRRRILKGLRSLLSSGGKAILLDSTPEIYLHNWASFSTAEFPGNRTAKSGDVVRTIITDIDDKRPVEDILWTDQDYRKLFETSGMRLLETYRPLARREEPYAWISETTVAPWVIYVLEPRRATGFTQI